VSPRSRRVAAACGAAALAGGVFLLRAPSFGPSVIDWDESIYLLVSRELLRGHAPYTVIWDHKPPGLYALFAGFQLLFGESITSARLGAVLAVAATCAALFACGKRLFKSGSVGALAVAVYAGQSLLSGGLAANAEVLLAPFCTLGFLALATPEAPRASRALAAGLFFGLAAQVKYVAAFELAGAFAGAAVVWSLEARRVLPASTLRRGFLAAAGFLAPFAVAALAFLAAGRFPEYAHANFAANVAYISANRVSPASLLSTVLEHARRNPFFWCGAILLPAAAILSRRSALPFGRPAILALAWLAGAAAGVASIGRIWDHYFLQLLPPLALLGAAAVVTAARGLVPSRARLAGAAAAAAGATLLLVAPLRVGVSTLRTPPAHDAPRAVAKFLAPRIEPGDALYVPDWEPALHYLVDARIPTRFVLPDDLMDPAFARMAGVDRFEELDRIFACSPAWVVRRASHRDVPGAPEFYRALDSKLAAGYRIQARIWDAVLYTRR
jgi:4-amino-4-deoxy-L-arabinose transferase-like glycosyltransferase